MVPNYLTKIVFKDPRTSSCCPQRLFLVFVERSNSRLEGWRGRKKKGRRGGEREEKEGRGRRETILHCRPWRWSSTVITIKLTQICTPLFKGAGKLLCIGQRWSFCLHPSYWPWHNGHSAGLHLHPKDHRYPFLNALGILLHNQDHVAYT